MKGADGEPMKDEHMTGKCCGLCALLRRVESSLYTTLDAWLACADPALLCSFIATAVPSYWRISKRCATAGKLACTAL